MILFLIIAWVFGIRFLERENYEQTKRTALLNWFKAKARIMAGLGKRYQPLPPPELFLSQGGVVSHYAGGVVARFGEGHCLFGSGDFESTKSLPDLGKVTIRFEALGRSAEECAQLADELGRQILRASERMPE